MRLDDEQCLSLMRLFNEDEGRRVLSQQGVSDQILQQLPLVGISGICNLIAAIKTAKFYEMNSRDCVFLPLTDSMALYQSRLAELREAHGNYTRELSLRHHARYIEAIATDHLRELGYPDRKALHNLKYFTWVEQQGKTTDELRKLWDPDFWTETFAQAEQWDRQIEEFNRSVG